MTIKKLLYFLVLITMLTLMGVFFYTKTPYLMKIIDVISLCGFFYFLVTGLLPRTYDGVIFASDAGEKMRWELQLSYDPEDLSEQEDVTFKIVRTDNRDLAN